MCEQKKCEKKKFLKSGNGTRQQSRVPFGSCYMIMSADYMDIRIETLQPGAGERFPGSGTLFLQDFLIDFISVCRYNQGERW